MKYIIIMFILLNTLIADPYIYYPGAKEKGMGGAATATVVGNAAMILNPAGMSSMQKQDSNVMLTLEGGSTPGYNQNESLENLVSSEQSYFFGLGFFNKKWSGGFSYTKLYHFNLDYEVDKHIVSQTHGIELLSATLAWKLSEKELYPYGGIFSIGVTYGLASNSLGGDQQDIGLELSGRTIILGAKARLINTDMINIDLGYSHRFKTSISGQLNTNTDLDGIDIPKESAIGISIMYQSAIGVMTLAADHKETGYEEATSSKNSDLISKISDYTTNNYGLELAFKQMQIRTGYYTMSAKNDNEITGITGGISLVFTSHFGIDASIDHRSYKYKTEDIEESYDFASLALNILF